MTRARISISRFEARAAINVPRVNKDIAQTKIGRVFILCNKKPVTGMTTDTVRRNAVVNHCTAPAVTLRSRMSRGIATAMSVSLRITTKVATRSRLMTSRLRPTVSATAGARTWSGDRLGTPSEFLFKYSPAMDHRGWLKAFRVVSLSSHLVAQTQHPALIGFDLRHMEGDVSIELIEERYSIANQDRQD